MSQYKAEFIRVPTDLMGYQTMPTEPESRLSDTDIRIEICKESDAEEIAAGFYSSFVPRFWNRMEPLDIRPDDKTRVRRLAQRLLPTMSMPGVYWVKAVVVSTGEIGGVAGWTGPGMPICNVLARKAIARYGFKEKMGWSDEEIDEMWSHVSDKDWNGQFEKDENIRRDLLGDEPHWHLAPLFVVPKYQARGIGKRLLTWAIDQADATDPPTAMYLESAPHARAVYMHCGWVPQGEVNMLRRGPAIVKGLEADKENVDGKPVGEEKLKEVSVDVVAKEIEADLAS